MWQLVLCAYSHPFSHKSQNGRRNPTMKSLFMIYMSIYGSDICPDIILWCHCHMIVHIKCIYAGYPTVSCIYLNNHFININCFSGYMFRYIWTIEYTLTQHCKMHIDSIYSAYTAYMLFGNIVMISNGVTSVEMSTCICLEMYHTHAVYEKFTLQSIQIAYIQVSHYILRFSV